MEMKYGAADLLLGMRSRQSRISKHISTLRIRRYTMLSQVDVRTHDMPTQFARSTSSQHCDPHLKAYTVKFALRHR